MKGDNEYATGALGHKRTGAVTDQGRLNSCAILMVFPVSASKTKGRRWSQSTFKPACARSDREYLVRVAAPCFWKNMSRHFELIASFLEISVDFFLTFIAVEIRHSTPERTGQIWLIFYH